MGEGRCGGGGNSGIGFFTTMAMDIIRRGGREFGGTSSWNVGGIGVADRRGTGHGVGVRSSIIQHSLRVPVRILSTTLVTIYNAGTKGSQPHLGLPCMYCVEG